MWGDRFTPNKPALNFYTSMNFKETRSLPSVLAQMKLDPVTLHISDQSLKHSLQRFHRVIVDAEQKCVKLILFIDNNPALLVIQLDRVLNKGQNKVKENIRVYRIKYFCQEKTSSTSH